MFNLEEYFKKIDLNLTDFKTDLASLKAIVKHHVYHFKYENTFLYQEGKKSLLERQIPSFDLDSIYQHLVLNRAAGYCFQNAELLTGVLVKCGFHVDKHLAYVMNVMKNSVVEDKFSNPTHCVLFITLGSTKYLVEVGIGVNSLREPLELKEGEQKLGEDIYLLTKQESSWRLHIKLAQGYFCIHQTNSTPSTQNEIRQMHDNLYTCIQNVPIRDDFLLLGRVTESKRKQLFWDNKSGFFKSLNADGSTKKYTIVDSYEYIKKLAVLKYGLTLPAGL